MKIIFDLRNVGLGDNGGSLTLVQSGNTLLEMGNEVVFIDYAKNQHTWTSLKAEHIIVKNKKQIPDADIILATGYKSVLQTVNAPDRCGLKAHWLRGWETWQMSELEIVNKILAAPTIKFVNSFCLKEKLNQYGVVSIILRPGYDFDKLFFRNQRTITPPIILGGLYTKGKHENTKRTSWIFKTYEYLKKKGYKVELWMFGNIPKQEKNIDLYVYKPSIEKKNWFYNHIDIWLAPTMLEGLHMPPAEAMLTQCPVVSTNAPMSGTQDYMEHHKTGIVADNNLDSFIKSVEYLCTKAVLRKKMGIRAKQKIISLGNRKTNMQKFVRYVQKLKEIKK